MVTYRVQGREAVHRGRDLPDRGRREGAGRVPTR